MRPEQEAILTRAQRRGVEWSARALDAAADELTQVDEAGALVTRTAEQLRAASAHASELDTRIVRDRELTDSHRRLRDAL